MTDLQQPAAGSAASLIKLDPASPVLAVSGRDLIAIKAGTVFNGVTFAELTSIAPPAAGYMVGTDYAVAVRADGMPVVDVADACPTEIYLGGFHFAPGGSAAARSGGDHVPAINPNSVWDRSYRPACPDPRGMTLVEGPHGKFWADIYLLGADHITGGLSSKHGVEIADGNSRPVDPRTGKRLKRFDYEAAVNALAHHGKRLLTVEEFFAAAFGVTERTACGADPEKTALDAARTSAAGLMQATGSMWIWGTDGDPDAPRASVFGGSWWDEAHAGSRQAFLGLWAGDSGADIGARGRCDHLQPA